MGKLNITIQLKFTTTMANNCFAKKKLKAR